MHKHTCTNVHDFILPKKSTFSCYVCFNQCCHDKKHMLHSLLTHETLKCMLISVKQLGVHSTVQIAEAFYILIFGQVSVPQYSAVLGTSTSDLNHLMSLLSPLWMMLHCSTTNPVFAIQVTFKTKPQQLYMQTLTDTVS